MMTTRPATAPPVVRKRVGRPLKQNKYDDEKYEVSEAPNDYRDYNNLNYNQQEYEFDENDFE